MKKQKKRFKRIIFIVFLLCMIVTPITFGKYITTISKTITLNIRKPEYDIIFKKNGLPKGYQEVEYIEGTGTQYILTDIIPDDETGIHTKLISKEVTDDRIFFGSGNPTGNKRFWIGNKNGKVYYGWNKIYSGSSGDIPTINIDTNTVNIFEMNYKNDRSLKYNGTTHYSTLPGLEEKTRPLTIFGYNNDSGSINLIASMKLYEFKISQGTDIIADFVPCYRISDNVAGLYDIIGDEFYTNSGTGTFGVGNDCGSDGTTSIDGTMSPQHFVYGTEQNLTACGFIKDGYSILEWNTMPDGTGTAYQDEELVNNLTDVDGTEITLYARWSVSHNVTINAGHGINTVTANGWTNSGTSSMTKKLAEGRVYDLSSITLGYKDGYEDASYTLDSGTGSISGSDFTVGTSDSVLTIDAGALTKPANVNISGGITKVYNTGTTTIIGSTSTTYDSGVNLYYSFGYSDQYAGTPGNWTTENNNPTYTVPLEYKGSRFYSCRIYASDGTITSETSSNSPASNTVVSYVNARINFNAGDGELIGASSSRYVEYNSSSVFGTRESMNALAAEREIIPHLDDAYIEDEVLIGDEYFYIVGIDDDNVLALTKYAINNTTIAQDSTSSSTAIMFASSAYWQNNIGNSGTYPGSYSGNPRPYVYDSNCMLYNHVNNYANKISNNLGIDVTGRLLSYEEASNLSAQTLKINYVYWLGSAASNSSISIVTSTGGLGTNVIYSGTRIRPEISFYNKSYAIPRAKKIGYTFNGWWTAENGGTQVVDETGHISANVTNWTSSGKWILNNITDNSSTNMLYAHWKLNEADEAYFDGDGATSCLSEVADLSDIVSFQQFTGLDSEAETLINNGTAVKIDDESTTRNIYAWIDNGDVYWWSDASTVYLPHKARFIWKDLENAEFLEIGGIDIKYITDMNYMFANTGSNVASNKDFKIKGLDDLDVGNVKYMGYMFYNTGKTANSFRLGDLSGWKTAKVRNMTSMFESAGYSATSWKVGDISQWDTGNVEKMNSMFKYASYTASDWTLGDFSGWDVKKVITFSSMFQEAGRNASSFELCLSEWKTLSLTNTSSMFSYAGFSATKFDIGKLDDWEVSKVTDFSDMFSNAGKNATTWKIGDLTDWKLNQSEPIALNNMFSNACYTADTFDIGNIGKWEVIMVNNMANMFVNAGYNASAKWNIGDLSDWKTKNVTNMGSMFSSAGYNAGIFDIGDIGSWDVQKVTQFTAMFNNSGKNATKWIIGKLDDWQFNTTNNIVMGTMFNYAGYNTNSWTIGDLSRWNTDRVTNMASMFSNAGYKSNEFDLGDIGSWNVQKVTQFKSMFANAGYNATDWSIGKLDDWRFTTTSNIDMSSMFSNAGRNATSWTIGDLSKWNTNKVTTMASMFASAGRGTTGTFDLGKLDDWNVSAVTSMSSMFNYAGYKATSWYIGDLGKWNPTSCTNMSSMFSYAGYNASATCADFGTLNVYATTITSMFNNCKYAEGILNIHSNPTSYNSTFTNASTLGGGIKVNYYSTTTNIDAIIATKSTTSNVVKGNQLD